MREAWHLDPEAHARLLTAWSAKPCLRLTEAQVAALGEEPGAVERARAEAITGVDALRQYIDAMEAIRMTSCDWWMSRGLDVEAPEPKARRPLGLSGVAWARLVPTDHHLPTIAEVAQAQGQRFVGVVTPLETAMANFPLSEPEEPT